LSATSTDGNLASNVAATTAAFQLRGELYGAACVATFGGGSVKLQARGPDGTTYLSVGTATDFSAAGYTTVYLPPGQYRWTIATASAVYASVFRIPV
jgi:hypothetical protein